MATVVTRPSTTVSETMVELVNFCPSGVTSNPPDAFSALEVGEIDDSANVAPFAQVGERLVDLIELVVPCDQLV